MLSSSVPAQFRSPHSRSRAFQSALITEISMSTLMMIAVGGSVEFNSHLERGWFKHFVDYMRFSDDRHLPSHGERVNTSSLAVQC